MLNALLIALSLTPAATGWQAASPEGGGATGVDAALATLGDGEVLLVEVSADWCEPCNQLRNEVLDTPLAARALADARGVVVDWETPRGDVVRKRYGILGIPTTLVLARDGSEIGRVEGYDGRDAWIEAVADAKAGRVGLEALARAAKAAPKDAEAQIALAQAQLVRGDVENGERTLRDVMIRGGDEGAHAARVLGRYYLRARDDAPRALEHFSVAMKAFDGTRHYPGFVYWTAKAHRAAGHGDEALALFARWRERAGDADAKPLKYLADFMVHHGYDEAASVAAAKRALDADPQDASGHYLLARALVRAGDVDAARAAVADARRLAPGVALYENFERGLPAPAPGRDGR